MSDSSSLLSTLLEQLKTPLAPVRRPPGYLPGVAATAVLAVLMPLVYLGIIAGVVWLGWWHLTNDWFLLGMLGHGFYGILIAVFVYFGPVLAGATMVVFLVRPLLLKTGDHTESKALDPAEAPEFTTLVHAVADAVGAPRPAEIRIDSQVNASASFRRGLAGFLKGELTLTVGLPLLQSMNTREVAGILGHEFGHFAQGGGMRLTFLVRSLISWFQRVVNHRDDWDRSLDRTAQQSDIRIGVFFHLARFFVGASRAVLGAVARLSHLVCVFLLRAMEYDADRHEARIAGSDQFAATAHHLRRLNLAWQQAHSDAARAWNDGALPRDFPAYVGHLELHLPAETDGRLTEAVRAEKKNLWSTHPRDADRIARAQAAGEPGILTVEEPCRSLFTDFQALAEAGSDVFYAARLGQAVDPAKYRSTEEILATSEELRLDREAFQTAVGGWAGLLLPLDWERHPDSLPADDAEARAAVEAARESIEAANAAYDRTYEAVRERDGYRTAQTAGYQVEAHLAPFQGQNLDLSAAAAALHEALAPVHRRFARAVASLEPDDAPLADLHRLFVAETDRLAQWQTDQAVLGYLLSQTDNGRPDRWNEIQRLLGLLRTALVAVAARFADRPYPFSEQPGVSVNDHLLGGLVASLDDPNALYRQSTQALDRASALYVRLVGRIARRGGVTAPKPVAQDNPH